MNSEELAEALARFFKDVSDLEGGDWWQHVIERKFECSCRFSYEWDESPRIYECAEMRHLRMRVEDIVDAERDAHWYAKYLRDTAYAKDWNEARQVNKVVDRCRATGVTKPKGMGWYDFVQAILP